MQNDIVPQDVRNSMVSDNPLLTEHVFGVAFEQIEGSSPYRTFICLWKSGADYHVQREEVRFRRTKAGVESSVLWSGCLSVSKSVYDLQMEVFRKAHIFDLVSSTSTLNSLDGEWYVVRAKDEHRSVLAYLYSPESSGNRELLALSKKIDALMLCPKAYFRGE